MYQQKYARFFAAFNASVKAGNPITRQEIIAIYTNGRTESIKDITDTELQLIVDALEKTLPPKQPPSFTEAQTKANNMRKAIIAIFYSMNKTLADAIAWAEKQGVKGVKKKFNNYTTGELFILITIAEKIKYDWQKSIRQQVANKLGTKN